MHRYVNVIKSAYSIPEYPIKDLLNGTRFTFRLLHLVSRSQDRTQTFIASVGSSRVNKNRKWGCTTVDCINPSCPRLMSTGHWANIRTTAGTTTYSMASKSCETFYGNSPFDGIGLVTIEPTNWNRNLQRRGARGTKRVLNTKTGIQTSLVNTAITHDQQSQGHGK